MKLFHGSTVEINRIDLSKSKPNKDFGIAFYLSEEKEQAQVMAQFKADFYNSSPVVTEFEFDESAVADLKYKRFEEYTEEWAHFVYNNRTMPADKPVHDYDIVYGPIANDRVGAQITRYKQGYISFDEFLKRIKFIKGITFQYAFCTQKAVDLLHRV